jgi:cytoskeletal protein RodZ
MAAFGDTLRQARAHKGISLIEAAQATYINRYYLVALEEENFSVLPDGATFRRGIVRHYASYLGLDPSVLIRLYEDSSGDRAVAAPIVNTPPPSVHGGLGYLNFSMIGVVAVLMLVGFAWFYSAYFGTSPSNNTPTQIIATLTPFDQSELNIPSPTPKPPTPTATVEPTATTEVEPTPTPEPTEEPDTADETISDTAGDTGEPIETPTEEVAANGETITDAPASDVTASIQVVAQGDIYVTITVDGETLFDGSLASGDSTQFYNGSEVVVTSSDPSLTWFTSATTTDAFEMPWNDDGSTYFP